MSSLEKRLAVFKKLPLRAQLAMIASSKTNETLNQNQTYIASLERVHAECLAEASIEEKLVYQKSQALIEE